MRMYCRIPIENHLTNPNRCGDFKPSAVTLQRFVYSGERTHPSQDIIRVPTLRIENHYSQFVVSQSRDVRGRTSDKRQYAHTWKRKAPLSASCPIYYNYVKRLRQPSPFTVPILHIE